MQFPAWVNSYIDLPYKEYNCYDLLRKIYFVEEGIELPSFSEEYYDGFDRASIKAIFDRELAIFKVWEPVEAPKEKDTVVFRDSNQPWHIGIVIKKGWMIHTSHQLGRSVIENYSSLLWRKRIVGFRRYKK